MAPSIVVGIDGSEMSQRALSWAASIGRRVGAEIQPMMVWDYPAVAVLPFPAGLPVPPEEAMQSDHEQAATVVVQGARGLDGVVVNPPVVARGSSGRVLCDAAIGADLLVVGSRGLGALKSLVMGSVSGYCVNHAPCPVAVVPTSWAPDDDPGARPGVRRRRRVRTRRSGGRVRRYLDARGRHAGAAPRLGRSGDRRWRCAHVPGRRSRIGRPGGAGPGHRVGLGGPARRRPCRRSHRPNRCPGDARRRGNRGRPVDHRRPEPLRGRAAAVGVGRLAHAAPPAGPDDRRTRPVWSRPPPTPPTRQEKRLRLRSSILAASAAASVRRSMPSLANMLDT